jgi:hypothetical protein
VVELAPEACPRGSVSGLPACEPGYEAVVLSREPLCGTCEPTRDTLERCAAEGRSDRDCRPEAEAVCEPPRQPPVVLGDCRVDFGVFFDGRGCVPLVGCELRSSGTASIYRSIAACEEANAECLPPSCEAPRQPPVVVGDCRRDFGVFFDGRGCVPLIGCDLRSSGTASMYRSIAACEAEHAECLAPTTP